MTHQGNDANTTRYCSLTLDGSARFTITIKGHFQGIPQIQTEVTGVTRHYLWTDCELQIQPHQNPHDNKPKCDVYITYVLTNITVSLHSETEDLKLSREKIPDSRKISI